MEKEPATAGFFFCPRPSVIGSREFGALLSKYLLCQKAYSDSYRLETIPNNFPSVWLDSAPTSSLGFRVTKFLPKTTVVVEGK